MNFSAIGCSFRTAPVEVRERLAIDDVHLPRALTELAARYGCESVIISTCNRVELYLASTERTDPFDPDLVAEFLGEIQEMPSVVVRRHPYEYRNSAAITHLFRVAASLDSLVVGEGQIAGQVKRAFELSQQFTVTGAFLNTLFNHALRAAKRVRTETGIAHGHLSVSSVALDCVKQVFDHYGDKTVLVIGAGEMGQETLRNLIGLKPGRIWVTNRSFDKAQRVAQEFNGEPRPWDELDDALAHADIVVSTTGSPEMIVTRERWSGILAKRTGGTIAILDIAVPRDFDPSIHDGDRTVLFNMDDLERVVEESRSQRQKHIAPAERIIEQEQKAFIADWARRKNGPLIKRLTDDCDAKREVLLDQVFSQLNGKLTDADRKFIEATFRKFQNQLLHAPIDVLREEARDEANSGTLREALRKLFRLQE